MPNVLSDADDYHVFPMPAQPVSSPLAVHLLDETGNALVAVPDTGSGIAIGQLSTVCKSLPSLTPEVNPHNNSFHIHGISSTPLISTHYVTIPLRFAQYRTDDAIPVVVHLVQKLAPGTSYIAGH
ncbi:hypothetical protein ACJ73_09542 [Blastomyces percursus]|uniref:Uncharacterized protein n=1 Tax=Blastomyces percursus TaxID=1658174 RepID=A0A1J9Q657_9EURO|nr:hypothetical protein ACJ73_09542 [Blastomyces percursus]